MRLKIYFVVFFLLAFSSSFLFPKIALADTFTLSGSVKDSSGTPISGATVSVNDASTDSTITDNSGNYSLAIPQGTYNIHIDPPSGSNFSSATAFNQNISTNITLNFILTPIGTVTLSGYLYDALHNPLVGQDVQLTQNSLSVKEINTDSAGHYSMQVAPGTYGISLTAHNAYDGSSTSLDTPDFYFAVGSTFSLTESKIYDFTLPFKKVVFHVQDGINAPVSGVKISTINNSAANYNLSLGNNITAYVQSNYNSSLTQTDQDGNAALWLFPNEPSHPYSFNVTPSGESNYTNTTLPNVTITDDTTESVTLQTPVVISGYIYDALHNPLVGQDIQLIQNALSVAEMNTDAAGHYSLQVAPGVYGISINAHNTYNGSSTSLDTPDYYFIVASTFSLTENKIFDFTLPFKKITFHIQDAMNIPVSDVRISTVNNSAANYNLLLDNNLTGYSQSNYNSSRVQTDQDGNATLWLLPNASSSSYSFNATPSDGSGYIMTNLSNITITDDATETINLQSPVTLSGHIYDALHNPLVGQDIQLTKNSLAAAEVTTDALGYYSLQVAPGVYGISINAHNTYNGSRTSLDTPDYYFIDGSTFSLTENKIYDFTLPFKKIIFHIQNGSNEPVNNVLIRTVTAGINYNLPLDNGIHAYAQSNYNTSRAYTDEEGNITLWLFPNESNYQYNFSATPSDENSYSITPLNNVTITGDQTEFISLQYSHTPPTTIASLLPNQNGDSTYPNPVTITLSSTATSGYTVANTYYTLDGGSQQTYTSPFTITTDGNHTITYWSIDNSGVQETHNSKTFTVVTTHTITGTVYTDANQNGFQDAGETSYQGAAITLSGDNSGGATTNSTGNYIFSSLQNGSYTVTLTLPNGYLATTSNPVHVLLTADTTVNFGIAPQPTPTNTVTPTPTTTPSATPTPTITRTPTPTVTPIPRQLTVLNPVQVWMSHGTLDAGMKLDIVAQAYAGNTLISSGQVNSVTVGSNVGPNGITLQSIPFTAFSPIAFPVGTQLKIIVSARNACSGSLRNSGTANLWYNNSAANSHFGATIASINHAYYLVTNALLSTSVGGGPRLSSSMQAGAKCSAFKSFGTWTIIP
ncbi:MAG TPA: carboxypeptidase regulatory-like domain-containing protein [Candidatus Saccharimonadales bacterium]|nr:carboxypeptidase regulatory-like domain-containing protein [Candidatus Saccharimonadales bacterium]